MTHDPDRERQLARQGRLVAVVIAATMVVWMIAQWAGGELGLEARYAFLFDFLALAGFLWAMIVTFQIWRKRRDD
jgi:threonine/homoserine/homoserine lactone efflux protein